MDVSIDEHGEKLIARLIAEGRYASAADVVEKGLRLLKKRDAAIGTLRREMAETASTDIDISGEYPSSKGSFTQD